MNYDYLTLLVNNNLYMRLKLTHSISLQLQFKTTATPNIADVLPDLQAAVLGGSTVPHVQPLEPSQDATALAHDAGPNHARALHLRSTTASLILI